MSAKAEQHKVAQPGEGESRKVAEAARESRSRHPSFLRDLYLGRLRLDLLGPFPGEGPPRPEFVAFYERLATFLRDGVDSAAIDATGEYPREVIEGLRRLGAFGMKIPVEYGGLGLSQTEYSRVMKLLGGVDGNLTALLSAHQSIGVPQPLKLFGTPEQKARFLPRCAAGAISAFALTEPDVGSDPARLTTTAERLPDGDFLLNGEKLWCTNGTLAELLVVIARDPKTRGISAFVVETSWPGVTVERRCRFMGLKALANAVITFRDVRVPAENLIGREGQGLKIALTTLNTGRLSLPAASVGTARAALAICRSWAAYRVQWGRPIGRHEAVALKIADMAATAFAMEAVSDLAGELADRHDYDIRLEAAAAKEWNTTRGWRIVDDTMQVRGGRGYETERSLKARGEVPIPVERMMRDFRVNLIFEGSSEVMHLFIAREAVDRHLSVAGKLADPAAGRREKLRAIPRVLAFYALWYTTRWLGWGRWPRYREFGDLAGHVRFVDRKARKLARQVFHGMVVRGPRLEYRQGFLFRLVDIGNELFAMIAAVCRAHRMARDGHPEAASAVRLADTFCRGAARRVNDLFRDLWHNDDAARYRLAQDVLDGRFEWMERDALAPEPPVTLGPQAPAPEVRAVSGRRP